MDKVLVTGGGGFVGGYVVENLRQKGIQVTVLDHRNDREYARDDIDVFYGDVVDSEAVQEAVGLHDGVIHLAGVLGTEETMEKPSLAVATNVRGSLSVFEACRRHNKQAVYISVGNYWMNNPYAITKHTAERFALMYNRELGTKIAIVRGFNIYGPRQHAQPVRKVVPTFVLSALRGDDINVYGTGNQIMDMIYVEDMAEILVRALLQDHGVYESAIDAGMGLDTTVNSLANLIIRESSSLSKVYHVPMRPGEESESVVKADIRTLERLGFSQDDMTSLEVGISKTVEWFRIRAGADPAGN